MKLLISLLCLCSTLASANAATTSVTVGGQDYTITYESLAYDSNESQFNNTDMPWWGNSSTAQSFAQATSVNSVHYGYEHFTGFGLSALYYYRADGNGGSAAASTATSNNRNYAVSAVAVPAPLPILGILPVVGFLKRMRKRQRT